MGMSERSTYRLQLRRVEPAYEPVYRSGLMQDLEQLAYGLFFTEYEIDDWNLPELTDEEKQSFLEQPERFLRNFLVESGFPHPINALAISGEAEECLMEATAARPKPKPKMVHIERHDYASAYVIK
jgi:hypothetical protein